MNDTLNKELLKMYKKTADEQNGNSDKELIDISSDDDSGKIEDIAPEKSLSSIATRGNSSKPSQKNTHSCLMSKVSKTETQMENEDVNQKVKKNIYFNFLSTRQNIKIFIYFFININCIILDSRRFSPSKNFCGRKIEKETT